MGGFLFLTKERFMALNAVDQQGFRGSSGLLFMSDDNQRSETRPPPPIDEGSRTPIREKSIEAAAMNEIWIPGVGGGLPRYPQPIMQLIEPSVNTDRYQQYLVSCEMAKVRVELTQQELIIHPLPVDKPISRRVRHSSPGGFFFRIREFYRKTKAFAFR
jgi:hypothetical protein